MERAAHPTIDLRGHGEIAFADLRDEANRAVGMDGAAGEGGAAAAVGPVVGGTEKGKGDGDLKWKK